MSWQDLKSAIVTLVVAVVAGLLVWFLTKEPKVEVPAEKLVYSIEKSATLTINHADIRLMTLKIQNIGKRAAQKVYAVGLVGSQNKIVEKAVTSSAEAASTVKDVSTDNQRLEIEAGSLVPDETITASMLVSGPNIPQLKVVVRSANAMGTLLPESPAEPSGQRKVGLQRSVALLVITGALFIQAIALIGSKQLASALGSITGSPNNTAFVLIHNKMLDEAEKYFPKK